MIFHQISNFSEYFRENENNFQIFSKIRASLPLHVTWSDNLYNIAIYNFNF